MDSLDRLSRFIERISAWFGGFLLLINISDIVLGVVARYFTNAALIWTEEVARISLVWLVLIGAASAFVNGDHMSIDFLAVRLHKALKALARGVALGVQLTVLGVLIFFGSQNVMGMWNMKTMALGLPKAIPLMAVPIGMSMLLMVILAKELKSIADAKERRKD